MNLTIYYALKIHMILCIEIIGSLLTDGWVQWLWITAAIITFLIGNNVERRIMEAHERSL